MQSLFHLAASIMAGVSALLACPSTGRSALTITEVGRYDFTDASGSGASELSGITYAGGNTEHMAGDVNLDGTLSGDGTGDPAHDDIAAFTAGWGTEHGFGSTISWMAGDLDLDGTTNLMDFALLREALSAANMTAPESPFTPVPEPSGLVLLIAGGVLGLLFFGNLGPSKK